jgi:hypothetical protein
MTVDAILEAEIHAIRKYTAENKDLQNAHHFLYDLRINKSTRPEFLVMGLNPGEASNAWKLYPSNTEETSLFDFMDDARREIRWTKDIVDICGSDKIVQSEHFFWSSKSLKDPDFKKTFGYTLAKSPHLKFCQQRNLTLLQQHDPKIVLSFGFASMKLAIELFNLRHKKTEYNNSNNKRLVEVFDDGSRVWLFARHLRAFGFKTTDKDKLKQIFKYYHRDAVQR